MTIHIFYDADEAYRFAHTLGGCQLLSSSIREVPVGIWDKDGEYDGGQSRGLFEFIKSRYPNTPLVYHCVDAYINL